MLREVPRSSMALRIEPPLVTTPSIRARGLAVPAVRRGDPAHRGGPARHALLPALPARSTPPPRLPPREFARDALTRRGRSGGGAGTPVASASHAPARRPARSFTFPTNRTDGHSLAACRAAAGRPCCAP